MSKPSFRVVIQEEAPGDWDAWTARAGGGFCQTVARSRMHAALHPSRPYFLRVEDAEGNPAAQALLILDSRIGKSAGWAKRLVGAVAPQLGLKLICHEGPVLPPTADSATFDLLVASSLDLGKRLGAGRVEFTPLVAPGKSTVPPERWLRLGLKETPWLTSIVDIGKDEQTMHAGLHQSIRKGIKKCQREGVVVAECDGWPAIVDQFLTPYFQAKGEIEAMSAPDWDDAYERWWRAAPASQYRFFVAKSSTGEVLATLGTYAFNGYVTEIMSARTVAGQQIGLPCQDLIHWHAFLVHRNCGDRYFNLAGYNPRPDSDKEMGIRRYKEKWGGEEHSTPTYRATSPLARLAEWTAGRLSGLAAK